MAEQMSAPGFYSDLLEIIRGGMREQSLMLTTIDKRVEVLVAMVERINGSIRDHESRLRIQEAQLLEHLGAKGHPAMVTAIDNVNAEVHKTEERLSLDLKALETKVNAIDKRLAVWAGAGGVVGGALAYIIPLLLKAFG